MHFLKLNGSLLNIPPLDDNVYHTGLMLVACLKTNCVAHRTLFKVESTIVNLLKLDLVAVSLLILIMAAMKCLITLISLSMQRIGWVAVHFS